MLTRKQALLALALMTSLPLAVWARADNDNFGGPGQGYGPFGYMNDTDNLKAQLDSIKDPKVKAKYIEMIKARMAFEQSQLDATKAFLDSQK